jgi:diaminohydroxyphosphoribosylaminopyrimidine deaminase/5-amino-6-(5-phosphoribosylamino)uracil reductase
MDDAAHMARALLLAERGRGRTSPNPMVGALVVDGDGVIVGRGSHERAGGPHAEVYALVDAGDRARGATLYCTLEPCAHTGRTGPCAPRVVEAGIRRAVIAVEDPNPRVGGRGLQYLRDHGVEVQVGVMGAEAARLNRPFFTYIERGRPFVTLKAAISLDGMVAARRGARTALTGPEANALVHQERAEIDAIAIGSETLLVDDPLLTARGVYRDRPLVRVVFDRRLRTSPAARLFSTVDAGPVIVMSNASSRLREPARADALERVGAQLELIEEVELDGRREAASAAFLRGALARLARREIVSLVVEGGPALHGAFWGAGLVDRVELFISPRAVGADGVEWTPMPDGSIASLAELTARPVGDDVRIEGFVLEGSRGLEGSQGHVHRAH